MDPVRPVSKEVNQAIGKIPIGAFNYGLYFQKWFYIDPATWKCATDQQKPKGLSKLSLLDNMPTSLKLINGDAVTIDEDSGKWNREETSEALKTKNNALESYAKAFEKLGYDYLKFETTLLSPLVLGLGNEHPTEKGFRFDWTLGIPAIPASSIKGVVRLAALVNELNRYPSIQDAGPFLANIENGKLPESLGSMFGMGGEKSTLRGKVIFFDAYPTTLPRLKPEIMNCHYPDYLNKGERGPTEDQQPNPQKYWAIDPSSDELGTPLKFIFRLLLHKAIGNNSEWRTALEEALKATLEEHGLGAKTAIGHGRFSMTAARNGKSLTSRVPGPKPATPQPPKPVPLETWNKATLGWKPNDQTVTASLGNKKAWCKGKELVPKPLHEKLFVRRRPVTATVEVKPLGGNSFEVVKIHPPS